jgi:hypothetical protein
MEGTIQLTELVAYMDIYGIDEPEEKAEFVRLIKDMDSAYLKERGEALKRGRDSPTKPNRRR